MNLNLKLQNNDNAVEFENCIVEKVIELSDEEYEAFCGDLQEFYDWISENKNHMFKDSDGTIHGMLVLGKNHNDGVFINSDNSYYARIHSMIPNARQLVMLNRYPALAPFIEKMVKTADHILYTAQKQAEKGNSEYTFKLDMPSYGEPEISLELLENMLQDSGLVDGLLIHADSLDIKVKTDPKISEFDFTDEDVADIEIMCAKHTLWLYEGSGEKLNLSGKKLLNIDFSNKDLCSAVLRDTEFVNCNFDRASLCFADFENAKFNRCSLKHFTAEESNFKDSYFTNCNLEGAYFTHSNFANAGLFNCNTSKTNLTNCCLQHWNCMPCNIDDSDMLNVSYSESEWLGEQESEDDQGMTMGGM